MTLILIVSRKCARNNLFTFFRFLCTSLYYFDPRIRIRVFVCTVFTRRLARRCIFGVRIRPFVYCCCIALCGDCIVIRSLFFNMLLGRKDEIMAQGVHMTMAEDDVAEASEQMPLKRFGKQISQHPKSGTVLDVNPMRFRPVFDPEVPDMDMTRLLSR